MILFDDINEELRLKEIRDRKQLETIVESVSAITAQAFDSLSTNLKKKISHKPSRDEIVSYALQVKKVNKKNAKLAALESYDMLLNLNSEEKRELHLLLENSNL